MYFYFGLGYQPKIRLYRSLIYTTYTYYIFNMLISLVIVGSRKTNSILYGEEEENEDERKERVTQA